MDAKDVEFLTNIATAILSYCAKNEIEREKLQAQFKVLNFPAKEKSLPLQASEDLQLNRENGIFTKKEIKDMPILKELCYRYKPNDRIHEFRYRRNGIDKSFSSTKYNVAKQKALEFCKQLNGHDATFNDNSVSFVKFAKEYLNNVKQKNVTEKTFFNEYNRFKNHIVPNFNFKIREIKAPYIQRFLNGYIEQDQKRTAEALFYLLKSIFDYAVATDVIIKSPMLAVKIPMHERKNGQALPLDVEKNFVKAIAGNKYELTFVVMLYSGCRPCELESITFDKPGFLTFINRKQKKKTVVFKDIPITPMLAPYVERIRSSLPLQDTTELSKIFKRLVPGYRLYDLRHTFATRCQVCGVPQEIVSRWLGHKSDKITDNTYTHYPQDFMLEMAKKVDY